MGDGERAAQQRISRGTVDSGTLRDELTLARRDLAELAVLREESARLRQDALDTAHSPLSPG